jgi:hypothetical protein
VHIGAVESNPLPLSLDFDYSSMPDPRPRSHAGIGLSDTIVVLQRVVAASKDNPGRFRYKMFTNTAAFGLVLTLPK